MKIALVHDWLTGYRGGEKVLEVLCEMYPEAPLYTLVHNRGSTTESIENHPIHTSFIQHLPFVKTKYRNYLPLFPLAAETLRVKNYDLIISTSHAVAKSIKPYGAKHWCYVHSPMRYIWDRFDDYFGKDVVGTIPSKLFFKPIAKALQIYDLKTSGRVHQYVANSNFVAARIKKYYHKKSEVIFPPVDIKKFMDIQRTPEDFYIFFSALVPYKKADHAIEACQKLGRRLIVIGHGPQLEKLKKISDSKWILFQTQCNFEDLKKYFSKARAFLFPGVEDFGIAPVEATASGLPIVGLKKGGLTDTQTNETCLFYQDQTVEGLINAIKEFESQEDRFQPHKLKEHSKKFNPERFRIEVKQSIEKLITS